MDFMDDSGSEDKLFRMLQMLTFETNFFKRIQALEIILKMMDDNLSKEVKADSFDKFMKKYTNDSDFMRKTMLVSTMEDNVETALEYYGFDYISSPDFAFDEDFFKTRRMIDQKINEFTGLVMKELNKEEDLFGDD